MQKESQKNISYALAQAFAFYVLRFEFLMKRASTECIQFDSFSNHPPPFPKVLLYNVGSFPKSVGSLRDTFIITIDSIFPALNWSIPSK